MYLAIDTETTGLEKNSNVLTACFIILDKNLKKIDQLDLNIKYLYYTIYPQALEVNKINIIQHHNNKDCLYANVCMIKLSNFLQKNKTDEKYCILGHNVDFDINMLLNNNIITNEIINLYIDIDNTIDTLNYAKTLKNKKLINNKQSLSLSKLCYYFELNNETGQFHTAEYDIKLTISLYKKLKELEINY
jgi:DNA polymerase III epsilon subunit-like protein